MPKPVGHKSTFELAAGVDEVFRRKLGKLLGNPNFDHIMGLVIMFNMLIIIVETDHSANNDTSLPWAGAVGWVILMVFIVELVMRLFVLRWGFFHDGWNTFDFSVVFIDSVFSILGIILGAIFPVSVLRILRLCKLARVSKVFRVFPELRILMAGLVGSFRAIFWGTVLLGFVLLVWAIIAVQFIHPLNRQLDEEGGLEGCERCGRAYSSVLQSTLTFSQQIVCGDSWGQATIPVIEAYPVTALYFMGVFLSVGIAVMNLILGVVVNVAMSEHERLSGEIEHEKNMARLCASDDLMKICQEMDKDGSGEMSKEELLNGFQEREDFREAISELGIQQEDLTIAFSSMDADKSGSVSYSEFVKKVYTLKDTDWQFLLEQIKYNILLTKDTVSDFIESQSQAKICNFEKTEIAVLETVEIVNECAGLETPLKPDMVDNVREEKEQKQKATPIVDGELLEDEKNLPQTPRGNPMDKEILDALQKVSQHLEGEFALTLKNIDSRLLELKDAHVQELQAASLRRGLASVPGNMAPGLVPAAVCCRV